MEWVTLKDGRKGRVVDAAPSGTAVLIHVEGEKEAGFLWHTEFAPRDSNLAAMYRMRATLKHYFTQSPHELLTSDLELLDSVIEEAEGLRQG